MTCRQIAGFETGGLHEFNGTVNLPTVQSSVVHTGGYAVQFANGNSLNHVFSELTAVDNNYALGAWFRFSSITPSTGINLLGINDQPTACVRVSLTTSGTLQVNWVGDGGSPDIISSPGLSANTWHFIELYMVHDASAGAYEVFVDGNSVGSNSGLDTVDVDYPDQISFGANVAHNINWYMDDCYFLTGITNTSDMWHDCRVAAYRSTAPTAAPDSGDGLTAGTWANMQEVPFSDTNTGAYDTSSAVSGYVIGNDVGGSAGTGGPYTDANTDGATIPAAKYMARLYRGGGSPAEHYIYYGNSADNLLSSDLGLGTSYAQYRVITENAGYIPNPGDLEYIICGMGKSSGARGIFCADMLAMIAYIPPASTPSFVFNPARHLMPFLAR